MSKKLLASMFAALIVGVLVAGCGGSDDGDSTTVTASSLSKPEFVTKVTVICKTGKKKALAGLIAYAQKHEDASEAEQLKGASESSLLPAYQTVTDEIQELGAPAGDEAEVKAYLAAMQGEIDEGTDDPGASLAEFEQLFKQSGDLATAYGIKECAFG